MLTSQAIGAWGVGIGIIALHASWENDWTRLYPMMVGYATYGALQSINLLRYPEVLDWTRFSTVLYIIFVISVFLTGVYGAWKSRQI
ncbi:MAG: hypothetical protein HN855_02835 [Anaerolineae bacterium]|nr:hypothetical protein [Anaerolineae bacterium]MBT7072837.1 hypothetical protein [Anaerolineae bacterium]MBT7324073.1 hypothetical protein [Anaerolineae bacterium]